MAKKNDRSTKATFNLRPDLWEAMNWAVKEGEVSSKNELLEQALMERLTAIKRARKRLRWEEASHDPRFLKEVEDLHREFETADAEASDPMP